MAYLFPATYQPVYQYQQQNQQNGIIWVQGEAGAKSYLVAPNNTVQLWDSESQTIYLKSSDATGLPSMKILDYTVRESVKNSPVLPSKPSDDILPNYVTKDEIQAITDRISALQKRVDELAKEDKDE